MAQFAVPSAFILIGLIVGFALEKFIDRQIKLVSVETEAEEQPLTVKIILLHSLNNLAFTWFLLAGCFAAHLSSSLKSDASHVIETILIIIALLSITIFLARLSSSFVTLFGQKSQVVSASLISNLVKFIVYILGLLIILQTVGVEITPILTTLGVGGLALALAVQDTLSNLFAGLYLIISQQLRTEDYVKLETGQEGHVIDINWRSTTIKDIYNNIIVIPNSKLSSVIFTNYHLPVKELVLSIDIGVSYTNNLEHVERVTLAVATEVMQEIAPELTINEPFIRYHTLGDYSINLTVFMRLNEFLDRRLAKHIFIKKLHEKYQAEKIEIPNPSRDIYIKEGLDKLQTMSI
ncbi:mechanosensitive ion channel protein [Dulcicalothrix desertica PCC 7102]|uniref:Mechanosensitive ion channel protein n=1 Tax=Dulcicalothrix desertica PCC 7102 TaxID=232991 RepID=A0A3S1C5T8_9CYAN|nr:mechanosensitive ion channel family protein [Dulcicalothrix desertica]RUS97484.1 mechanosensitive ion channel protein [Dulcicalothrix desertica PCC 7102]TWH62084.1 small-conductance mechanosensitive channel [Dulcicalothrix desertica PCC 7102]